ncbi:threonine/serine exporter family protein [Janibacter sp. YIM B02568]|uniref:threonine/serine ThrE exporter family protein n=1 Tax=Janibacter endophyticus TaxID=2806261 RepID=UPI0019503034|nr:threonine/serine exporter family protein [Janibacter endophyticus]MBM6545869.1 threonine/serine exporter family protein [Janibacter endophyticus]
MTETLEERDRRLLAWLGAGLLAGGMPVHEAEEDVREAALALGHPEVEVGCFPTALHVALAPGRAATFEKVDGGLRLDQLADVSAIHAGLRTGRTDADAALEHLASLRGQPHRYPRIGLPLGVILSAAGIALVLAPAWSSLLFAVLLAPVTVVLILLAGRHPTVRTLVPLAAAFATAAAACWAHAQGLVDAPLWTLVAPIAVLLPGATIVTGLTELAAGAMVAGTARLGHGTTQMLLFALGVGGAVALQRVPVEVLQQPRPDALGWGAPLVGVVLVTVAIALMEALPLRSMPWLLVTVLGTYLGQLLGHELLGARWAGAFAGAVVASLGATLVEFLRPQLPRAVAFLPCFWLLVPGSLGLISVTQIEVGAGAAVQAVVDVTSVIVAIALGVMVGAALARPLRLVARRLGLVHLLRRLPRRRSVSGRAPRRGSRSPRSGDARPTTRA